MFLEKNELCKCLSLTDILCHCCEGKIIKILKTFPFVLLWTSETSSPWNNCWKNCSQLLTFSVMFNLNISLPQMCLLKLTKRNNKLGNYWVQFNVWVLTLRSKTMRSNLGFLFFGEKFGLWKCLNVISISLLWRRNNWDIKDMSFLCWCGQWASSSRRKIIQSMFFYNVQRIIFSDKFLSSVNCFSGNNKLDNCCE